MRSLLVLLAATTALAACSTQTTAPADKSSAAVSKKAQCYNGDAGKFVDVGTTATISGVNVTCEKTSDGKGAQWMGKKH